jgi:hypothetical protein
MFCEIIAMPFYIVSDDLLLHNCFFIEVFEQKV